MTLKDRHPFAVDQLNQMQRYLGEEMIEDYHTGELIPPPDAQAVARNLRECGGGAALLAACGEGTATAAGSNRRRAPPSAVPAEPRRPRHCARPRPRQLTDRCAPTAAAAPPGSRTARRAQPPARPARSRSRPTTPT